MIDSILALEKPIMLFFQSLRVPFLSVIAEGISFLGETAWTAGIMLFVFYCIDKRKGFGLVAVSMSGHVLNNIFKVIFRIPRPWVKYPDEIIPLRQSTATGYSFPSGHSENAGSMYFALYKSFSGRTVKTISVILLVLIPLSRIYLGVHWPLDVVFGLALGMLIGSAVSRFTAIYDTPSLLRKFALIGTPIAVVIALTDTVLIDLGILDATLWKDLSTTAVVWGAVFLSSWLEKTIVDFKIQESWVKRIVFLALSLAVGYAVTLLPLSKIGVMHYTFKRIGYFLFVFWEMFLWPLIAVKTGLFEKEVSTPEL